MQIRTQPAVICIGAVTRDATQRLSTYAYDLAGWAVLSTKGRPQAKKAGKPVDGIGIEQVRVQYLAKLSPQEGTPVAADQLQRHQRARRRPRGHQRAGAGRAQGRCALACRP